MSYPVRVRPLLGRFLSANRRSVERHLQLDRLGSEVWNLIDGQKSVAAISEIFRERHLLTAREAEIAVSTFLQQLGRKGLVALRDPEQG